MPAAKKRKRARVTIYNGVERRTGPAERRNGKDRRSKAISFAGRRKELERPLHPNDIGRSFKPEEWRIILLAKSQPGLKIGLPPIGKVARYVVYRDGRFLMHTTRRFEHPLDRRSSLRDRRTSKGKKFEKV